jgi:hypothetical protein
MKAFTPKIKPTKVPFAPERSDADVTAAAAEMRRNTIGKPSPAWLTGGLGVPNSSQNFSATQLLGGGS